jgi:hypothetical protein
VAVALGEQRDGVSIRVDRGVRCDQPDRRQRSTMS